MSLMNTLIKENPDVILAMDRGQAVSKSTANKH